MSNSNLYFNSTQLRAFSNDTLFRKAPAVFAEAPKSTTSDNYLFIPTIKLVDGLRGQGWEVVAAKQSGNRKSSIENKATNKHSLFLTRQENLQRGANFGDALPMLKLTNSHNGMSTFSLSSGFFRVVCANGLTVPDSIYSAPKVRHTRDMANDVVEATYKVLRDFPLLLEMKEKLGSIELTEEEKFLLADSAADIFFQNEDRSRMNQIARKNYNDKFLIESQLVRPFRYADRKNDLWTVSNVIQENLIKGGVRLANDDGSLRSQRVVTSIDRDNDIHEKLFLMTQKFAELKGVKIGAVAV